MRFYAITIDQIVIRFYLMMGVVLLGMFSGYYAIAFLALPLFLSAVLGIRFRPEKHTAAASKILSLSRTEKKAVEKAA